MTEKQHNIFFIIVLFVCVLLILTLNAPTRNYIPIVWGFLGFALHAFLFWKTWIVLSRKLIDEHISDLNKLKISYHNNKFKKVVDMFALFEQKKEIKKISADIESRLSFYLTYFRLTIIAFPLFAALGIMTVVFTW